MKNEKIENKLEMKLIYVCAFTALKSYPHQQWDSFIMRTATSSLFYFHTMHNQLHAILQISFFLHLTHIQQTLAIQPFVRSSMQHAL